MCFGSKLEDIFCYQFGEPYKIIVGPHGRNSGSVKRAKRTAMLNVVKAVKSVERILDEFDEIDASVINVISAALCSLNHILHDKKDMLSLLSDSQLDEYQAALVKISARMLAIQNTLLIDLDESVEALKSSRAYAEGYDGNEDEDEEEEEEAG